MLKRITSLRFSPRWPELRLPRCQGYRRRRWIIGAALVGAGLLALVSQFADARLFGLLFLPIFGLSLLIWGIGAHHEGLLTSGSVVSGLGVGVLLIEHVLASLTAEARGGIFLLAVAGGWAAISPLTALLRLGARWWPLLPAGVLALVGVALLLGGAVAATLALIGQLWPAVLVIAGLVVLLRREPRLPEGSASPEREVAHRPSPAPTNAPTTVVPDEAPHQGKDTPDRPLPA